MIKAILFDISGVLHVDKQPIQGAATIVQQLQTAHFAIRYVTNSSRSTSHDILESLNHMGFQAEAEQVFTAPGAVRKILLDRNLRPYCLVHENLEAEYADIDQHNPNSVVVADAAERFDYQHLNIAFQLLLDGAPLIGIGRNKYFRSAGRLMLDAGPFIHALEYAAGVDAEIMGKPDQRFFMAAVDSLGCQPEDVLMIGDDAEADVEGALEAGLQACLVRTGKYCDGDENKIRLSRASIADSVVEAVSALLENPSAL